MAERDPGRSHWGRSVVIRKEDILERARSWSLRAEIVEKDYVLGWLLAALSRNAEVRTNWLFKGGTCLKKCYFETYRFSEDLDFSLRPAAVYTKESLLEVLRSVARDAHELSGIEFPDEGIKIEERHNKKMQATFLGKVPYRGPLVRPQISNILLDLTAHEILVDDPDEREIFHPYPDDLPENVTVVTYSIDELLAEKTRALFERTRPRDLYDVVQIVENHGDNIDFNMGRDVFRKKCEHKSITQLDKTTLKSLVLGSEELKADWEHMLVHQLPALPPIDGILLRLDDVLSWVDDATPAEIAVESAKPHFVPMQLGSLAKGDIVAPPSVTYWGAVPIEQVRFAGANRLLVSFMYHGKPRVAEPYALRRASAGHLLLYAWERGDAHIKAFKVDEISNLSITNETFSPRYTVELTGSMIPSTKGGGARSRKTRRARFSSGVTYVFRCSHCGREFKHDRNSPALRPHNDASGYGCSGRRGYLERVD